MKDFSILKKCPLFNEIGKDELDSLLSCLSGQERSYRRGETVLFEGDRADAIGIVVSGGVHVTKDDYFGNRNIIAEVRAGDMFGEALVCAEVDTSPMTVVASDAAELLLIDYKRIVKTCPSACGFHTTLIKNMLRILAQKNMSLVDKLEHLTRRTTREKALSYLSEQARLHDSNAFEIPFNRQELADFLSVERSALSAELSKLRDEGVIKFKKNHFELLRKH